MEGPIVTGRNLFAGFVECRVLEVGKDEMMQCFLLRNGRAFYSYKTVVESL